MWSSPPSIRLVTGNTQESSWILDKITSKSDQIILFPMSLQKSRLTKTKVEEVEAERDAVVEQHKATLQEVAQAQQTRFVFRTKIQGIAKTQDAAHSAILDDDLISRDERVCSSGTSVPWRSIICDNETGNEANRKLPFYKVGR